MNPPPTLASSTIRAPMLTQATKIVLTVAWNEWLRHRLAAIEDGTMIGILTGRNSGLDHVAYICSIFMYLDYKSAPG